MNEVNWKRRMERTRSRPDKKELQIDTKGGPGQESTWQLHCRVTRRKQEQERWKDLKRQERAVAEGR